MLYGDFFVNFIVEVHVMAIKHYLALDIPDTAVPTVLRIVDASVYGQGLPVECPRLDIYLPGFQEPVFISEGLTPGFSKNISGIDLGLQHPQSETLIGLPDGLYKIRYSISPNEKVFVEYYHLRTTKIMNAYAAELCRLQLEKCEPTAELHKKLHDLRYIKLYLDGAKAKAEQCHAPAQAIDMMTYAEKLLSKYHSGCCISCGTPYTRSCNCH